MRCSRSPIVINLHAPHLYIFLFSYTSIYFQLQTDCLSRPTLRISDIDGGNERAQGSGWANLSPSAGHAASRPLEAKDHRIALSSLE